MCAYMHVYRDECRRAHKLERIVYPILPLNTTRTQWAFAGCESKPLSYCWSRTGSVQVGSGVGERGGGGGGAVV